MYRILAFLLLAFFVASCKSEATSEVAEEATVDLSLSVQQLSDHVQHSLPVLTTYSESAVRAGEKGEALPVPTAVENEIDNVVKQTNAFLNECGVSDSEITEIFDDSVDSPLYYVGLYFTAVQTTAFSQTRLTWGDVGDCLLEAIGFEDFAVIAEIIRGRFAKKVAQRVALQAIKRVAGPAAIAWTAAEFGYCLIKAESL